MMPTAAITRRRQSGLCPLPSRRGRIGHRGPAAAAGLARGLGLGIERRSRRRPPPGRARRSIPTLAATAIGAALQTPVSGSTSRTSRAAAWSPAISATTERTCS